MRALSLTLSSILFLFAILHGDGCSDREDVRALAIALSFTQILAFFLTRDRDLIAEYLEKIRRG